MNIENTDFTKINESISEILKGREIPDDTEFRKIISRSVSKNLNYSEFSLKDKQDMIDYLFCRIRGFDILQPLIENENITEIMVNGPENIFYEEKGVLFKWDKKFDSQKRLCDVIFRLFSKANKSISESTPISDVRLSDGSRANAVLSPIAPDGPVLTIRKFTGIIPEMNYLIENKFISVSQSEFLIGCIRAKKNIFISGGTGTGKTTFLNVLSGYIPKDERIVTIEDSSELKLQDTPNLVRLESRNALPGTENGITVSDLIRCALRMRPDRIIVGEVRGKEASDMLWAMNTGHPGSMSTGHSNSPRDMLSRLCIMVRQSSSLPVDVINSIIANAIDVVVHLARTPENGRCVEEIIKVNGFLKGEFEIEKVV
jgi:pilus assembly protein CpaF